MADNSDLSWNYWKHYDKRTVDRYVDRGVVKPADFQSRLKNLPDETNNAEWVKLDVNDAEVADEVVENEPEET
ncbi:MAG: hypothetical protein HYR96_07140 [Deltaproteobacteria bacterium]|nr:hypothetical protein [Deltaproteobacteria bacterium]MBI3296354.1 hypothetical protein [Deltaproteobacteria bacterium]